MNTHPFPISCFLVLSACCLILGCPSSQPEPAADLARFYSKGDILEEVPALMSEPSSVPGKITELLGTEGVPLGRDFTDEEVRLQEQIDALVLEISETDSGQTTEIKAKLEQLMELAQQLPAPTLRP